MRPACMHHVSAPSSTLLCFLRCQIEDTCFFTQNAKASICPKTRQPSRSLAPRFSASTRSLTTSPRTQANVANVESSLLNLDFLRPPQKYTATHHSGIGIIPRPCISLASETATRIRNASTDTRSWSQIWKQKNPRKDRPDLHPSDLHPLPSFLDEVGSTNLGRSKSGKSGSELKLRCTELDENGNVTTVNGEFKKSELIAKVLYPPQRVQGSSLS